MTKESQCPACKNMVLWWVPFGKTMLGGSVSACPECGVLKVSNVDDLKAYYFRKKEGKKMGGQ